MKKVFAILAFAALCPGFAGCSDDDKDDDDTGKLTLHRDQIALSRGDSNLVWVSGGDGEYSAVVDNPAIASVAIQQTNLGPAVWVKAQKEGSAVITVTDKNGSSAQCSLTIAYKDIALHGTTMRIGMLNTPYHEPILGGSGKFTATVENPDIADVSINLEAWELLVTARKEGETKITVTDTEKNKSVSLSLIVKESGYQMTEIRHAVDAAEKSAIEKDLLDNPPYPVGSTFYFSEKQFVLKSPDGTELHKGTFTIDTNAPNTSYGIAVDDQIMTVVRITFDFDGREAVYNMIFVRGGYLYFCEDLTAYYKVKYPDAGVKQVGRGLVCRNNWMIN